MEKKNNQNVMKVITYSENDNIKTSNISTIYKFSFLNMNTNEIDLYEN